MTTKILVADDDDGYRFPIVTLLQDFGFETKEATNRIELTEFAPNSDIWIIDIRLPTEMQEGLLAVQDLVNQDIFPCHPVIFISVLHESLASDNLKIIESSSINYVWLEKPFELEQLLVTINKFLA